ncbi:hypothetical protein FGIG_04993 [Fasciola gigantica]|uniref:WW domain-containing protein n=1 Tax=Fasciola gigantica TaxID=46835 RepID=A0A504YT65_FASGI|nr:hypothetical protein FGIG_04993 [Fasciola gigantica]
MEVFTDCSGHSGDTVNHRTKRMGASRGRSEKNAIRVCGDWSEQLSSKGKIYFYNCITEVSQWQKPPEWKLPDMDHDELVRLLRAREQLDTRSLKRPRVVGASHTNSVKDTDGDQRSASPKRAKYIAEIRALNPTQERKPSPNSQSDTSVSRSNCITPVTPKICLSRRLNSRLSPRKAYDDRPRGDCRYAQSRRETGISANRLVPTDDMDISPDSSPMSGGSSPLRHSYHAQPAPNKRIRTGLGHIVPSDLAAYGATKSNMGNQFEPTLPSSKSSGPLLQLVDALRASLGLFGDSPNPGGSKGELERFPTANGSQTCGRSVKSNHSSVLLGKDEKHRTPSIMTRESLTRPQYLPSPENSIPLNVRQRIPEKGSGFSSSLTVSNNSAKSRAEVQGSNSMDNPSKNISGLVSTLTTLVSLISNNKYVHPPPNSSPSPTVAAPGNVQTNYHRIPSCAYVTTQRTKPPISSPVIPSPLTPSANTGTSSSCESSNSRITHSMLASSGCSLSSHQMDDLLSSLENLTQQARSGTSRLTECYPNAGRKTSVHEFTSLPEERILQTSRGVISPHTTRPYCWSQPRGREPCDNASIPNVSEKLYRDSDQSSQVDRISDLVKVLKSAVEQHLSARSSVSSSSEPPNPAVPHRSAPAPIHEIHPTSDSSQTNRGESKSYENSIVSSFHHTVVSDSHTKPHTNGQLLEKCEPEPAASRFLIADSSPCPEGGAPCSNLSCLSAAPQDIPVSRIPMPSSVTPVVPSTVVSRAAEKQAPSPVDRLLEDKCLTRINKILNSPEAQQFLDSTVAAKYTDKSIERLEHEAQIEANKFDQLQSVLYGELSVESKKLRALVRISEAKLAIHKEKQTALQELMDSIETRRHLPCLSFSDDILGCSTLAGSL